MSTEFFSRFAELDAAVRAGVTPALKERVEKLADEADNLVRLNLIDEIDAEAVWCFRDEVLEPKTGG